MHGQDPRSELAGDLPEIDHECTEHAVCPHCGHVHRDDWEWNGVEGTHECDKCGEPFKWFAEVSRTWDTEKIGPATAK
jgi:hypothetical protein